MNEIIESAYFNIIENPGETPASKIHAQTWDKLARQTLRILGNDTYLHIDRELTAAIENFAKDMFSIGYSECMRQISNGAIDLLNGQEIATVQK